MFNVLKLKKFDFLVNNDVRVSLTVRIVSMFCYVTRNLLA